MIRGLALLVLALLSVEPAFAQSQWTLAPTKCGARPCGAPIEVRCEGDGKRQAIVVVPWSRTDLPARVMAGTLTRLTFSNGAYRSSLYGFPRMRVRDKQEEAVFDLNSFNDGALLTLLRSSENFRVSGDYGSYKVNGFGTQAPTCLR